MSIYKLLDDTFFVFSPVLRNYAHGSLSLRPNIVVGKYDSLDQLGLVVLLEGKSFSVIMFKVFCQLIQRKSVGIPRLNKSGDGLLVVLALVVFWVLFNILFLFILIIIEYFASFRLLFFLYLDKRKFNFSFFLLVVFIWDAVTFEL